jgi:hypothetical protein
VAELQDLLGGGGAGKPGCYGKRRGGDEVATVDQHGSSEALSSAGLAPAFSCVTWAPDNAYRIQA